jgi:hypothetical protein
MKDSEREKQLKELCDYDFIVKLKNVAVLYGWLGDYYEIYNFVTNVAGYGGIEFNTEELEPIKIEYDEENNK